MRADQEALAELALPDPRTVDQRGDELYSSEGWADRIDWLDPAADHRVLAARWNSNAAQWHWLVDVKIGALWLHGEGYGPSLTASHALAARLVLLWARTRPGRA